MATQSKNTPTIAYPKRRGANLAHASGWCAGRTMTPTRSVSAPSLSTPTRSVSEGPATQIDWRIVGLAGVMAGLLVVGSVLAAWATAPPMGSIKGNMASLSRSPQSAGLAIGAKPLGDKDRSTNGTDSLASTKAVRDGNDSLTASSVPSQPNAIYPETDNRVTAPAPVPGIEAERKSSPEPDCETAPAVVFARDPMQGARLAREEHKLMLVLHVSGNFEESKFT